MNQESSPVAAAVGVNRVAVAAVVLAVLALAVLIIGGQIFTAIFVVGAGHIALGQIARSGERGRALAVISLAIGYAMGVYALAFSTYFWMPFAPLSF